MAKSNVFLVLSTGTTQMTVTKATDKRTCVMTSTRNPTLQNFVRGFVSKSFSPPTFKSFSCGGAGPGNAELSLWLHPQCSAANCPGSTCTRKSRTAACPLKKSVVAGAPSVAHPPFFSRGKDAAPPASLSDDASRPVFLESSPAGSFIGNRPLLKIEPQSSDGRREKTPPENRPRDASLSY
ncbi:serine/threonine-protein kinase HSL1,negative regulator of Swe1 kinase [Trypanosoma cruzi]|nr:serine/threonine-protein kinase HSL1,negative regulator of Swe1 kinase [Trypanosoma cruzi]